MIIGGSIRSLSLGDEFRKFEVTADSDGTRDFGGFSNTVESFGSGNAREIKLRKPLKVGGIVVGIDDDRGDQEFLQEFQDTPGFKPFRMLLASGISIQGVCQITGDLEASTMNSTCPIELSGPGKITIQA